VVGGDGLIEWFNQTLKAMLRRAVSTEGKGADPMPPIILEGLASINRVCSV